jgi:hypothetical protein
MYEVLVEPTEGESRRFRIVLDSPARDLVLR